MQARQTSDILTVHQVYIDYLSCVFELYQLSMCISTVVVPETSLSLESGLETTYWVSRSWLGLGSKEQNALFAKHKGPEV